MIEGYDLLVEGPESACGNEQGFLVGIDVAACKLFDHLSEFGVRCPLDVFVGWGYFISYSAICFPVSREKTVSLLPIIS